MLRIDNLKLPVGAKEDKLRAACAHALRVSEEALVSVHLLRRSIDAREGVKLVCSCAVEVKNESGVLRRCKNKNVQPYAPKKYTPPAPVSAPEVSPVVIGAGPAGLFCALLLARCGARPILLERGRAVEQRKRDVEHFWRTGELDLTSNVQFGEGGAGAFSDGKLNTGTKDLRHGYILEEFVRFGASEDILVDAKPHVGTDKLYVVLQNLRREIIDRGGEVRFSHKVVDIEQNSGSVTALRVSAPEGEYTLPTKHVVLAPGHSARDTFEMLQKRGVPMEPKPFAVGVRIEHRQNLFADLLAGRGNRNINSAVVAVIIAQLDGSLFRFRKRDAHQLREAALAARQAGLLPNLVIYLLLLQNRADCKAETVQIAFLRGDIIALVRHIDRFRIHVHIDGFRLARHLVLIELVIAHVLLNLVDVQVVDVHLRRLFFRLHCAERAAHKQTHHTGQQQNLPFLEDISHHLNEINLFLVVSHFLSIRRLVRHAFSPRSIFGKRTSVMTPNILF